MPISHSPRRGGALPNGHPLGPVPVLLIVVVTIRLTFTGEPPGVTEVLPNLQAAPAGKLVLLHDRLTCWLNPFDGVKVRV